MKEWLVQNINKTVFLTILIVNILIWSFYFSLPSGKLLLKVYDVGQGDAIFLETAAGFKILIDGGPNNKVLEYLGKELPFYSKKIDLLILSHPDADHITGLLEVVKQYQIKLVWVNGDEKDTRLFENWEKIVNENKLPLQVVSQGDKLVFPDSTEIKVLWPEAGYISSKSNNKAIVVSVSFGNFEALLTADADKNVQPYTSGLNTIEFLKVPHHGAKEALDENFVKAISPQVSVISVGNKNRYGHPSETTINILTKSGSEVYRTDKDGSIEIVSDGESWYTRTNPN